MKSGVPGSLQGEERGEKQADQGIDSLREKSKVRKRLIMAVEENKILPLLYSALALAFELHGKDSRKKSPVPYMSHLLTVCAMVQQLNKLS